MLKKIERNISYPSVLLLSNSKRKTFESLGKDIGKSGDTMARLVTEHAVSIDGLVKLAQKIFLKKRIYLLIDDTLILKIYSQAIEGTSDNYSSSDRKSYRSLCSVVGMLTDGITAIPIDQKIWTSKEFNQNNYSKKWELAQVLISEIKKFVNFKAVILDGLYAVKAFMNWLCDSKIFFEMRFHSNRVIEKKGKKYQIKKSPFIKLKKGRVRRTIKALWQNMHLHFTAFKRQMANGEFSTVFQVSNFKALSSEHIKIYGYRWKIEKFFRTAKQKLGLNDCQSRKLERQKGHIFHVFIAYSIAQYERVRKKIKNVEDAIKSIKTQNSKNQNYAISRFRQIFQSL